MGSISRPAIVSYPTLFQGRSNGGLVKGGLVIIFVYVTSCLFLGVSGFDRAQLSLEAMQSSHLSFGGGRAGV